MNVDPDRPPLAPRPQVLDPTRARPEPWFVGNGTGLMIGVLVLCAVLILVRLASIVWLIEAAEGWWHSRAVVTRLPFEAARLLPQPARPVPPANASLARRPPEVLGNPGDAFSPDLYPDESIRRNEQGRVVAQLALDASGTPRGCRIVTSSGFARLDNITCDIARARLRYRPARDEAGRPIPATVKLPVRWALPD